MAVKPTSACISGHSLTKRCSRGAALQMSWQLHCHTEGVALAVAALSERNSAAAASESYARANVIASKCVKGVACGVTSDVERLKSS